MLQKIAETQKQQEEKENCSKQALKQSKKCFHF